MAEITARDRILLTEREGDVTVVTLGAPYLNYAVADEVKPGLTRIVTAATERGRSKFVLNLSRVSAIDSSGLDVLISLKKRLALAGGNLALTNLSPMIERLFEVTRLDRAFDIYPSVNRAVEEA